MEPREIPKQVRDDALVVQHDHTSVWGHYFWISFGAEVYSMVSIKLYTWLNVPSNTNLALCAVRGAPPVLPVRGLLWVFPWGMGILYGTGEMVSKYIKKY